MALAQLHETWGRLAPAAGPCPGVRRRLARAEEWRRLLASGWRPSFFQTPLDPVEPWAQRAWRQLSVWVERVPDLLEPWIARIVPLHPCLCDIWHDHVFYQAERVSGLIDYGSVRIDHSAVDLARLLGSLAADDTQAWHEGMKAYAAVKPLSTDEQSLAAALDRTGTILGAAAWLKWLYHDGRSFSDRQVIAKRLEILVQRLEIWTYTSRGVPTVQAKLG